MPPLMLTVTQFLLLAMLSSLNAAADSVDTAFAIASTFLRRAS